MSAVRVLAISCSPGVGGRTRVALEAVLSSAAEAGAAAELIELGDPPQTDAALAAMLEADAFVFGSPMYRASYASSFKVLLDRTPRGIHGEEPAPLAGKAVLTVATAGSDHHFLGPQAMRNILVDFFAAHVVSPGVYVPAHGFVSATELTPELLARAHNQGLALVELARAIRDSAALKAVTPNA